MERKFTLRIGDDEDAQVGKLKILTNESTDSGAIKAVIRDYAKLRALHSEQVQKNRELSQKVSTLENKIKCFLSAFSALNTL